MTEYITERKIRILHVITGLSLGGAEMTLYRLLARVDKSDFEIKVISLTTNDIVGERIERLGIPVISLGMKKGIPNPVYLYKLYKLIKRENPDLIQTWMYHADLIGGFAARFNKVPVVWNIRHTQLDLKGNKFTTILIAKLCAFLSHQLPEKIVCCARAAMIEHQKIGYDSKKLVFVPNGFDLDFFQRNKQNSNYLKQSLGLTDNILLVGLIARFHPQKDHLNFIKAAQTVLKFVHQAKFILCGEGIDWKNNTLMSWIKERGLENAFILLGHRDDIRHILFSLDILVSSSYSEGFPNVVAEAMASGVPCVVTDAGDSAEIVGNTGRVVPPKNPLVLAEAIIEILTLSAEDREKMGKLARKRIEENYSLPVITKRYIDLYREIIDYVRDNKRR